MSFASIFAARDEALTLLFLHLADHAMVRRHIKDPSSESKESYCKSSSVYPIPSSSALIRHPAPCSNSTDHDLIQRGSGALQMLVQ